MNSIITGGYSSIEQAAGKLSNKKDTSQASGSSGISFQDILKQKKNIFPNYFKIMNFFYLEISATFLYITSNSSTIPTL